MQPGWESETFLQGAARIDARQQFVRVDNGYARTFGYPLSELIGLDWKSVIRPEEIPTANQAYEEMQASGIGEFQCHALTKAGVTISARILLVKSYESEIGFLGHFCLVQTPPDPTPSGLGIRCGDEVFQVALERASIGGILLDPVRGFRRTNEMLRKMLGYSEIELLGKDLADITHPQEFDKDAGQAYLVLKGNLPGYRQNWRILRKDGAVLRVNISIRIVRDAVRNPVYAIGLIREFSEEETAEYFRPTAKENTTISSEQRPSAPPKPLPPPGLDDITAQKRLAGLLRVSEERYNAVADSASEGILLVDCVTKKIIEATRAFLQLTGFSRLELARFTLYDLIARDAEVIDSDFGQILAAQVYWIGERPFKRKDGLEMGLEIIANTVFYRGETVVRLAIRDLGERRALEEQLRHAVKMEALGRFAGGIAHDFNNLLVGILGNSSFLEQRLEKNEALLKMAREITRVGLRARELTSQLLSISRRQVLPTEDVDLNFLVSQAETLFRRIMGEDIEIISELDPAVARVRANPGQIEQVIVNLAANSRDAMPNGGTFAITTRNVYVDHALASRHPGFLVGKYALLSVTDNGVGMDSVTLSHIFEPFYTTKAAGVGSGLGLSTVYGIIDQIGGYIVVESKPGEGTTFSIYLRPSEDQGSLFQTTEVTPSPPPPSPTVLVVEDEATVRSLVQDILKDRGFTVLTAENPDQALQLAHAHNGPIHLLITDIIMPHMMGWQLASELSKLRPETRVLYMSGYSDTEIVRRTNLRNSESFIQKPFTPDEFYRKVREVLEPTDSQNDHVKA